MIFFSSIIRGQVSVTKTETEELNLDIARTITIRRSINSVVKL